MEAWREWLCKRGITDEVIRQFELRYAAHPTLRSAIVIPVKDADGTVVFNKYRRFPGSMKPKYVYDKGGLTTLYGWHLARDTHGPILICEGELDALAAWSQGIPAVSSTGGALSFKPEWAPLFADREVYVCFDSDQAGGEGMARILMLIPTAKMIFLNGHKDICDFTTAGGELALLLSDAREFTYVQEVVDARAERLAVWQNTYFHDAYIEKQTPAKPAARHAPYDNSRLAKAKAYPMTDLIKFRRRVAICPWHHDKTASLQYYASTNTVYCFGACGKRYDSIDAYMLLHSVSFKDAINALTV